MGSGEVINGVNVNSLRDMLREISEKRELVQNMSVKYGRIRWLKRGFRFRAYVRNFSFDISEPASLDEVERAPNAVEYVLSALGACLLAGFLFIATLKKIEVYNAEIAIEGEIDNILVFLGLSTEGHPGYKKVRVKLYVSADSDEGTLKEIWKEAVKRSPVANTFINEVELISEIKVI